jgi:hypothetical protein
MRVRYINEQDKSDPLNGVVIAEAGALAELLNERRNRMPFMAGLVADNGFELMIGIGPNVGCAQHSRTDGAPPYLMAVSPQRHLKNGYIDFLASNTPTPVAARYILSFEQVMMVSLYFLETGGRSNAVSWSEFDPGATREDVLSSS